MDSIDALDWFAAMHSEIGLPIVEKELKMIRTVQDVVNYFSPEFEVKCGYPGSMAAPEGSSDYLRRRLGIQRTTRVLLRMVLRPLR